MGAGARAEGSGGKVEGALGELGENLGELGETAVPLFRERQLVIDQYVELALLTRSHLGRMHGSVQLGHETRGPFVIAPSDGAVEDANVRHGSEPSAPLLGGA
jgi:hypothetical protein